MLSVMLPLGIAFQQFAEEGEEGGGGNGGGNEIRHRLRQKYGKGFVSIGGKKGRQNEDHGDQQDHLPQKGHQQAGLGLAQSHKGLLATDLETHGEAAGQENTHGPGGIIHQSAVIGKDPGKNLGHQHQHQPKDCGIPHANRKLAEKCLFHSVHLSGAEIVAD